MGSKKKKKLKKTKKKIGKILLILLLLVIMSVAAMSIEQGTYMEEAEQLLRLGILKGTGNGLELDREPTRLEGLVIFIRLAGKEDEAIKMGNQPCPFTDVPDWAVGYANYANHYGLSKGIGNNLFGSNQKLSAQGFVTYMLRALEYDDGNGDFTNDKSIEYANEIGLLSDSDVIEISTQTFLRDHLVKLSMLSINTNINGKTITLLDKLMEEGTISKSNAAKITNEGSSNLEVHFIDVGQADSVLIKKGNEFMLIDAGNNSDGELVVNYLKDQNVNKLKYVIGTHPHEDHIGGLDNVINNFEIEKIILPNSISTSKTFEDVLDSISNKGLSITKAKVGDTYDLNGAIATILAPNQNEYDDYNNYSVVMKITNGDNSYLFTGDAEVLSEKEIISNNGYRIKADVLKVGHHGSSTSTSKDFLNAVDPDFAIISVGEENKYGHPNQEILDRLSNKGVTTIRTDLQGTIVSTSNGKTISFNTKASTQTLSRVSSEDNNILDVIKRGIDKIEEILIIKKKFDKGLII